MVIVQWFGRGDDASRAPRALFPDKSYRAFLPPDHTPDVPFDDLFKGSGLRGLEGAWPFVGNVAPTSIKDFSTSPLR